LPKLQILDSVVRTDAVLVVDTLAGKQLPAKMLLHDEPVFFHAEAWRPSVDLDIAVRSNTPMFRGQSVTVRPTPVPLTRLRAELVAADGCLLIVTDSVREAATTLLAHGLSGSAAS